ncbi:MAG: hypothetical protein CMJ48_08375 [Planctomycetaceae bacterium]|nr:hypothetical protein [Planctomycetaceae bacterium]
MTLRDCADVLTTRRPDRADGRAGRGLTRISALATVLLTSVPPTHAYPTDFQPAETLAVVLEKVQQHHPKPIPLDRDLSKRWFEAFFRRLDPQRMYFLECDLQEFCRFESQLITLARNRDFAFPKLVRQRFELRVIEATQTARRLLEIRHDFSLDEQFPREFLKHASGRQELAERWRLRIKFELLTEKLHGVTPTDARAHLLGRYRRIARQARELDDQELATVFINALVRLYDPHSVYINPRTLTRFSSTVSFTTYTLGLPLRNIRGQWTIEGPHPYASSRAFRSHLVGWQVMAVRSLDGDTYDLVERNAASLDDLLNRSWSPLRVDTEVILELLHPVTHERRTLSWPRFEAS